MCGIVGAIAQREVASILLEGLKRLEYRGYDSAGIAVIEDDGSLTRLRKKGKVGELVKAIEKSPLPGKVGIAHTRWATHGEPSERNAHPHTYGNEIAVVHNGIIENHEQLHAFLREKGYQFASDTDSEIVGHLTHYYLSQGDDLLAAVQRVARELQGAFALAIIHKACPDRILLVRRGSPLVIGLGIGENFIASDHYALLPVTQRFIYLEEDDVADIRCASYSVYDKTGKPVEREIKESQQAYDAVDRGQYRHFMQKEIFQQARAISDTLEGRLGNNGVMEQVFGEEAANIFPHIKQVQIVACGTSYHAGMVGRYWLEGVAKVPCQVEIASEFRYRDTIVKPGTLLVTISQSGETADTLAALRLAKTQGYAATLVICNVPESSLVRESDLVLMTRAGVEIGVASTKAFTTQLTALLLLTATLGRHHGMTSEQYKNLKRQLLELPRGVEKALSLDNEIKTLSKCFADKRHTLFLGRGSQFPIALEGALKLKEISYIHAEAYPAGELKHGPLALVDAEMPVVVVAPNNELLEKLKSNLQEVRARGGELIVFADHSAGLSNGNGTTILAMPAVDDLIAPIIYTIPLQLLSYHVAVLKGTDVDQPRNLAKSVTVE